MKQDPCILGQEIIKSDGQGHMKVDLSQGIPKSRRLGENDRRSPCSTICSSIGGN